MNCPECGADIKFSYVVPEKSFKIENGVISRDDAWEGPGYDDPYLEFYCSNDKEHTIDTPEIVDWSDKIESQYYMQIEGEEIS